VRRLAELDLGVPAGQGRHPVIAALRADASAAIRRRDAIDDCFSPAWRAAHEKAVAACKLADAERDRLAKDPSTRYGDWRAPSDIELMNLGCL
jgi:hypothetical protein